MYNPDLQYRCTIIRGKSISRMDDYLPIYAEILQEICPISAKSFAQNFDDRLSKYIKDDTKTIRNHSTENVDKLLGLVYEKDEIVYLSDRTVKYLNDNDQPALFKSVCFQFQQPNGSQKIKTVIEKIQNKITFRPYHFIIALLQKAQENNIILTKQELGYYVLNALEVLQGKVSVVEVLNTIQTNRAKGIDNKVAITKNYAWDYQHINEQFDYLKLANLAREEENSIWLNSKEKTAIDYFIENLNTPLAIDYSEYDLSESNIGKKIELEWQEYFGNATRIDQTKFDTSIKSLDAATSILKGQPTSGKSTTRVTPPKFDVTFDTINLTRNEWVAAEQHAEHFYIYRIYFTNFGTFISIINNPVKKNIDKILYATPTMYRVEFFDKAVDEQLKFS